jgi:hypothetical protein
VKTFGTFALSMFSFFLISSCVPSGSPTALLFDDSKITGNPGASGGSGGSSGPTRAQSLAAFKTTVYPVVRSNTCLNCHDSHSRSQSPVFADSDPEKAFDAITLSKKVDLTNSASSRIYLKVLNESHNCWSGSCQADADAIKVAIDEWIRLAPGSAGNGIATDTLKMPLENTAVPSQTEYGTLLLQAEQETYRSEVVSGRFFDFQDSLALDGKYLSFTNVETNPITSADRNLIIDGNKFNDCREFIDADLVQGSRAIKIVQERVHIPSGETTASGKVINDGYKPYSVGFGFSIVRPDKRIQYAKLIMAQNYLNAMPLMLTNGSPQEGPKVPGTKVSDTFSGTPLRLTAPARALPFFVPWSTVFNPNGSYKTSGTFAKDDGSTDNPLYTLFKDGAYSPDDALLQKKLMQNPEIKRDILYKRYKETVSDFFYANASTRRTKATIKNPYSLFDDADVITYASPIVSVALYCPAGLDCTANPNLLKFRATQSGPALTYDNALDCYTVNGSNALVSASPSSCNGTNPAYFHYIDIFIKPIVTDSALFGSQTSNSYDTATPGSFVDYESFTENTAKRVSFHTDQSTMELDPDAFFAGGASQVSDADNVNNFTNTLYNTLKTTRCIDCHGNSSMQNAPQFVSSSPGASLVVLKNGNYIDFNSPKESFRPNGMIHNCNGASNDPKYSCDTTAEEALRKKLTDAITAWKSANTASADAAGALSYRVLSRDEKLPGRVKYNFNVTDAGMYNVWLKVKNVPGNANIFFRLQDASGNAVRYSQGTAGVGANSCFKFNLNTSADAWEWTTPGRSAELAALDQRGYQLLDNNKVPLPLANNRTYFNLAKGSYTLDVIGLSTGAKIDALGVNKVDDMTPDSRLAFQPDRRAIDEKNISDYKRKVLRYDLTNKLGLPTGKQAYFEVEVKKAFNNQNYVFRNPRFVTSPRDFNLHVKGLKVYINGKWNYPDATYKDIDVVTGDNKVLTYAPLVALVVGADDLIHFEFDKLEVTTEALTPIFPKGSNSGPVVDRRCNDLDYFVKNVKPILRSVKVSLNSDIDGFINAYPGGPRTNRTNKPQTYNCITCHTQNHPYFKMSTFTNDEEFCREALSRVDFDIFAQSLIVRGINGTGNHPKFVFVERFVNDASDNFKLHDNGQDYLLGRYKNNAGIASEFISGPIKVWTKADMGITATNYTSLTTAEKAKIVKNGLYRTLADRPINMDIQNYSWYDTVAHYKLLFDMNSGDLDNTLSAFDVIDSDPLKGKLDPDRNKGPKIFDEVDFDSNGIPYAIDPEVINGNVVIKASKKTYVVGGEPAFDKATIDYVSSTPAIDGTAEMNRIYELQRDYYREKVINWIRRENNLRND